MEFFLFLFLIPIPSVCIKIYFFLLRSFNYMYVCKRDSFLLDQDLNLLNSVMVRDLRIRISV